MRVALVVPGGVDRSGEYRVIPALLAFIERLAAADDVEVFALQQEPQPASWQLHGAPVHNIGVEARRLRAVHAIRQAHRRQPFDVVHAFWSDAPGLVAVAAARSLRLPSLVHVAGGELAAVPAIGYGGGLSWRGRLRERLVLRAASRVTAASQPLLAQLEALGVGAMRVPLGVDLRAWPLCEPRRRDPAAPVRLVHVGSINAVKDHATLLHACQRLLPRYPHLHLDIVGEDTLAGAQQALAQRLGLAGRVTFHGFRTQRQLRPILEPAHLMLLSSRHEAGPVVVLEAAALGIPTVGSAVGHVAEWAPHAARAVSPGDAQELARVAAEVLDDEELRLQLARNAQAIVRREDADHTAARFAAIYREIAR